MLDAGCSQDQKAGEQDQEPEQSLPARRFKLLSCGGFARLSESDFM